MILKGSSIKKFDSLISEGISFTQGVHQLAQKFTNITFPRLALTSIASPDRLTTSKDCGGPPSHFFNFSTLAYAILVIVRKLATNIAKDNEVTLFVFKKFKFSKDQPYLFLFCIFLMHFLKSFFRLNLGLPKLLEN